MLERRIASISGSTAASDVALKRKLEAQLTEAKEELNETYYSHAQDSLDDALDAEAEAYQETLEIMIESMRDQLEEVSSDMESFLSDVATAVSMNAGVILEQYQSTGLLLDPALTTPWENAAKAVGKYAGDATTLMDVWKKNGYFAEFKSTASTNLSSPWKTGTNAANTFKNSISTVLSNISSGIKSNIKDWTSLTDVITTTAKTASNANVTVNSSSSEDSSSGSGSSNTFAAKTMHASGSAATNMSIGTLADANSKTQKIDGANYIKGTDGYYYLATALRYLFRDLDTNGKTTMVYGFKKGTTRYSYYAKGTTGISEDQWAIIDELGPELVLRANPETGRLDYMTAGTGIIPADLTENLMEWGQFTPDSLNVGSGVNVNMIDAATVKPEFNLNVDNFLRCDNVSQDSLPELKQFVKTEMNNLIKQMNYSVKKYSR